MKIAIAMLLCLNSALAAFCEKAPGQINTQDIYAEVINSRSHLSMDLVLLNKQSDYYSKLIEVKGGADFSPSTVPSCNAEQNTAIEWLNSNIANHATHSYDSWQATYRICIYNVRRELKASFVICNWNTGD